MNGYEDYTDGVALESWPGIDEFAAEDDESYDFSEGRGRRSGRRGPHPARARRYATPPPNSGYVTEQRFLDTAEKIRKDVGQNAAAITSVANRVDALGTAVRKDVTQLRQELRNSSQMAAIMPLLTKQSVTTTSEAGGIPANTKLLTDSDGLATLLPLLMMAGGGFAGGGAGGTAGQGQDMTSMLLLLVLMNRPH